MMEELVEKWGDYGLLEGIPDEEKHILATRYERVALHCLGLMDESDVDKTLSSLIFSVVYRVFKGIERDGRLIRNMNVSSIELYGRLKSFYETNYHEIERISSESYYGVDVEVEFVALFVEDYLGYHKYKSPLIKKYIKKHNI